MRPSTAGAAAVGAAAGFGEPRRSRAGTAVPRPGEARRERTLSCAREGAAGRTEACLPGRGVVLGPVHASSRDRDGNGGPVSGAGVPRLRDVRRTPGRSLAAGVVLPGPTRRAGRRGRRRLLPQHDPVAARGAGGAQRCLRRPARLGGGGGLGTARGIADRLPHPPPAGADRTGTPRTLPLLPRTGDGAERAGAGPVGAPWGRASWRSRAPARASAPPAFRAARWPGARGVVTGRVPARPGGP